MPKTFKVKMPQKGRTPCNRPKQPEPVGDAGSVVGRASLSKLRSAQFYNLLQLKNIPERSKARSKEARVRLLAGVTTWADCIFAGGSLPCPPPAPRKDMSAAAGTPRCKAGYGTRLQAAKWAGLAPRVNQSGHKKRSTGHIYKGGNKWLRRTCWIVAKESYAHAGKEGHPVGDSVRCLYKGGKKAYKVAVTAGARKFLTLAHRVLTVRRPFPEVWPELAEEEAEANRLRKKKELAKRVKQASTSDLLLLVVAALRRQVDSLTSADASYATEITAILGAAYTVESA